MRRIAAQAEKEGDWVTPQIRLALGSDPLRRVAAEVLKLADKAGLPTGRENRIAALLDRVQSIAASGVSVGLRDEKAWSHIER